MRDMTNQWERFRDSVTRAAEAPPPAPAAVASVAEEAAPAEAEKEKPRLEDLVARIRELLGKYPEIGSRQLYDLALRLHPELEQAGWRSFHARYVLPLKRERARAEGRIPKRRERKLPEKPARKPAATPAKPAAAAAPPPPKVESAAELVARRARVRAVLLQLARQVAVAESRADLVDVLARVEELVDQVLRAVQPEEAEAEPKSEA